MPSAASFYVPSLPDLHQDSAPPLHIYAGHLPSEPSSSSSPANAVSAHLYFFLIKARRTADKERILFWFNGGPGCSSFDGLMMEVGPWRVDGKGGLRVAEGGWEEYTTMVYSACACVYVALYGISFVTPRCSRPATGDRLFVHRVEWVLA